MSSKPQKEAWAKHAHTVYVQAHAGREVGEALQELTIGEEDIPAEEYGGFAADDVAPLLASVREEGPGRAAHEVRVRVCVCVCVWLARGGPQRCPLLSRTKATYLASRSAVARFGY